MSTRQESATARPPRDVRTDDTPGGVVFWVGAAMGVGIMAFGIRGVFGQSKGTRPLDLATWVIGADLLHDLVIAPLVIAVGVVVLVVIGSRWRPAIRAGLMASAIVLAVGWAPLRGYGRATAPDNPTIQPLNYATAVWSVIAFIWIVVALWCAIEAWRGRPTNP